MHVADISGISARGSRKDSSLDIKDPRSPGQVAGGNKAGGSNTA